MKIFIISLLIFTFAAANLQAQMLGFFTAKEGLSSAAELANQNVVNPKLVSILTFNAVFSVGGFGSFTGEFKYSGNDIGKANVWLYTFSPEGDPTNLFQVAVVYTLQTFISLEAEVDLTEYGADFAYNKYVDTATMLDSDEFTAGLIADTLFEHFPDPCYFPYCLNVIGIATVVSDFSCVEKDKISWIRYLIALDEDKELCCRTDFDDIDNLTCYDYSSILEDYSVSNISIYPSPAKDFVSIFNPDAEIITSISYDINGKMLSISNNTETIDVSALATGKYYICFELGNKKIFRALSVQ